MPDKIKKEIMTKIKNGDLNMRSRWFYVAQKIGLKSGLALSIIVSAFLVNLFLFYVKTNNLLQPLHMGEAFYQKLFHNLPYTLIMFILLSFVIINYLFKKTDIFYKIPKSVTIILFLLILALGATLLFCCGLNGHMQMHEAYNLPVLSSFYTEDCVFNLN
jgi:hypothetical protein